ncbi:MAG: DNA repair protein rad16 [Alyxoria varia]|nr:MAG: DNA repair protein rad16 [Alyxoria varia]
MADTSNDAELAKSLQEKEYGGSKRKLQNISSAYSDEESNRPSNKAKRRTEAARSTASDNSSDEQSSDEESDWEVAVTKGNRVNNKRRKLTLDKRGHQEEEDSDDEPLITSHNRKKLSASKGSNKKLKHKPRASASNANSKNKRTLAKSFDDSDSSPLSELDSEDEFAGLGSDVDQLDSDEDLKVDMYEALAESDSDDPIGIPVPRRVRGQPPPLSREWIDRAKELLDQGKEPKYRTALKRMGRVSRERCKLEVAHPEIATMWEDLKTMPKIKTEKSEQPAGISRALKSFQLEGLNWMTKQEQTRWKGGLLGDEMGMGKTIQAVSLIMSDYPQKKPTLVVTPPVALMQWTSEIKDYTDGKLKVLLYHGTNPKSKKMSVKDLKQYDVILISYSSLESVHRKETKGWSRENKIMKEDSAIHAIDYHRLVLDEAHSIKSRVTGVAKGCFALKGRYKWCLSGTPVQNRIGEFFSLLRFLDVKPFANYFCKDCACSQIHWSMDQFYNCTHCSHRSMQHVSVFNQEILNPITQREASEQTRRSAFEKLRLLTDRIMLRRMKRDETASMELPPKDIVIHNQFFGEIERDFASSIMGNTSRQFDTYVARGVMLNNYANIFGLIMQMRQIADHPDLITKKHAEEGQNVLVCNICDEPAEEAIRSRCKHEFCRSCVKDFIKSCDASGATADCPRCHIELSVDVDAPAIEQDEDSIKRTSIVNRIKMENWTSSTKIEMLVYDLWKLRNPKSTTKSIVFSQFTSMLQLIEWRLRRAGFNTVMLDGSMSPAQRQKSIEHFMNNTNVEVFLVSLKAGGVALNLTEASRVFIVDPWWNPAAEWQSADRCHRIGQKRPCMITRLCVEDSIESRIVQLQEKKANMINSTVNNDDVAMDKLTPEDMQFLFRGS